MKSVVLLFLDHRISVPSVQNAFGVALDFSLFDFSTELKKQMELKDELASEMNAFIERGEFIPSHFFEKFITKRLQNDTADKILMCGYPRSVEQFQNLEKLFEKLDLSNDVIWFAKQRDPELYLTNYFEDPNNSPWLEKYGSEVIDVWWENFRKNRERIESIMNVSKNKNWHIFEMDYPSESTK